MCRSSEKTFFLKKTRGPTGTWKGAPQLILRETQVKPQWDCHLTSVRMTVIEKPRNHKCWQDVREEEPSWAGDESVNECSHKENSMEVPENMKNVLEIKILN